MSSNSCVSRDETAAIGHVNRPAKKRKRRHRYSADRRSGTRWCAANRGTAERW